VSDSTSHIGSGRGEAAQVDELETL
jgi:hypothetical protein